MFAYTILTTTKYSPLELPTNSLKHGGLELALLVVDILIIAEPRGEEALEAAAPGLKEPPLLKGPLKLLDLLNKAALLSQRTGIKKESHYSHDP